MKIRVFSRQHCNRRLVRSDKSSSRKPLRLTTSLILIVDDQDTNRRVYTRLAATVEGARIESFALPEEALLWLEVNQPDLIITDFRMPGLDGADFTRRVRAMPFGADLPIVVVTVFQDRSFRLAALEAGATDFLLSPVDHVEFRTRVRNLLALRRQQQQLRLHASVLERELAESESSRERLLRDSREALAQVIDTVPAYISAADRNGRCVFANAHLAAALNTVPAELVGRDMAELLGPAGAQSRRVDRLVFERGLAMPAYEEERQDSKGQRQILLTAKAPLRDAAGRVVSVLTSSLDITARKLAEQRLHHLAHHDALTNLPNRTLLTQRLAAAVRGGEGEFALHFVDLDRFKAVNDVFGHRTGDVLLREMALRLGGLVRPCDLVARLGGDEFAILQAGVASREEAAALADRVACAAVEPFMIQGRELGVGVSIGVSLFPQHGTSGGDLLRAADLAMYQAKADGRGSFRFFDDEMDARVRARTQMETDLRAGLTRGELVLHYQPQLCLKTQRVTGAEALLRWQLAGGRLISPAEFLPVAEEAGLMWQITEWVLEAACRQGAAWRAAGMTPLRIGVNISPVQLERPDLIPLLERTLAATGLRPQELDLELTEGALVQHGTGTGTDAALRRLRELGVRLSIDDFGTGYSALSYLRHLPVHRLKIDRSFIHGLAPGTPDAAIVRTIVQLGHGLGLQVAAEGIETQEEAAEVRASGCDEMQGYLVARPMPADEFAAFMLANGVAAVTT
jgi:diguanylate cyclase (GGDEF)-like protein/PAS domain S-box-containing protein